MAHLNGVLVFLHRSLLFFPLLFISSPFSFLSFFFPLFFFPLLLCRLFSEAIRGQDCPKVRVKVRRKVFTYIRIKVTWIFEWRKIDRNSVFEHHWPCQSTSERLPTHTTGMAMLFGWYIDWSVDIFFSGRSHYCSYSSAWLTFVINHHCPCPPARELGNRLFGLV